MTDLSNASHEYWSLAWTQLHDADLSELDAYLAAAKAAADQAAKFEEAA